MHTFQKSLEAVLQRLGEVEIGQKTLENAGNIAGTENEILLFRNQLKVCKYTLIYNECIHCLPRKIRAFFYHYNQYIKLNYVIQMAEKHANSFPRNRKYNYSFYISCCMTKAFSCFLKVFLFFLQYQTLDLPLLVLYLKHALF